MHRASNAFSVLQATAAIVALTIVLWSVGLPSFRFAEAANVTTFSDTLSDSAPGVVSNHTITFTTPTGVANGQTITLDFSDGPFVIGSVDFTDIDVATTSDYTLAADCSGSEQMSAAFSSELLTITLCAGDGASIPANGTTTIEIGTNATFGEAGDAQLTNPAAGSWEIDLTAGASDTGTTIVAITPVVIVTASVDTVFEFTVAGVATGELINGDSTTGSTTATAIPFGNLLAGSANASTAAQDLSVVTNARNGFVVTVEVDQQLTSSNGAVIDGFQDGSYEADPTPWDSPSGTLGQENTYGHWGLTTSDKSLTELLDEIFFDGDFVSASTTPVEVFRHDGPVSASPPSNGVNTARVGYRVEITALQAAADDYQATLTYIATPVF